MPCSCYVRVYLLRSVDWTLLWFLYSSFLLVCAAFHQITLQNSCHLTHNSIVVVRMTELTSHSQHSHHWRHILIMSTYVLLNTKHYYKIHGYIYNIFYTNFHLPLECLVSLQWNKDNRR